MEGQFTVITMTNKDLKFTTLKGWCMRGILGKMGADGKYYVKLSEINKILFNN